MSNSIFEVIEAVRGSVENIQDPKATRVIETASVGDVLRQGDVYCLKVSDKPGQYPKSARPRSNQEVSNHHFLEAPSLMDVAPEDTVVAAEQANPKVKLGDPSGRADRNANNPLCGPWFSVTEEQAAVMRHGTHAIHENREPGTWLIYYQRELAEELKKTQD